MHQLARLRWQCRRGTKELDLLLQRYLETQMELFYIKSVWQPNNRNR
jgi:succinate dehydrogenase flavin-adding protein (antitoxin of CptAB toxin-antitoxin module)